MCQLTAQVVSAFPTPPDLSHAVLLKGIISPSLGMGGGGVNILELPYPSSMPGGKVLLWSTSSSTQFWVQNKYALKLKS